MSFACVLGRRLFQCPCDNQSKLILKQSLVGVLQKRFVQKIKRFYKNVSVSENNGSYEINLDKRKLKTPMGKLFHVPNEALAVAVATEWQGQLKDINIHNMHITSLCNTAIDNPAKRTKKEIVESTLEFMDTDTLCYRLDEPPELVKLQSEKWDPVLEWFEEKYHVKFPISEDITTPTINEEGRKILQRHLFSYSDFALLGFHHVVENLNSLVLGCAVVDRFLDVEAAISLSMLEVEYQTKIWGKVEWAHDIEIMHTRARVAAAVLFVYLNSGSTQLLQKRSLARDQAQIAPYM